MLGWEGGIGKGWESGLHPMAWRLFDGGVVGFGADEYGYLLMEGWRETLMARDLVRICLLRRIVGASFEEVFEAKVLPTHCNLKTAAQSFWCLSSILYATNVCG